MEPQDSHDWNLTIERLCWLATRDQLDRKARKLGAMGWIFVLGSRGGARGAADARNDERTDKMADYAVAVDAAAAELSAEERQVLRATGAVPEWFIPDVERRAGERRKHPR